MPKGTVKKSQIIYWLNRGYSLEDSQNNAEFHKRAKSCYNLEHWLNKGYSKHVAERLVKEKRGSAKNIYMIEYWTQKGYSVEEAKQLVEEKKQSLSIKRKGYKRKFNPSKNYMCLEYYIERGDEDPELSLKEVKEKFAKSKTKNKISYWLDKGYTEDEAKLKVKEYQSQIGKKNKRTHATKQIDPKCVEYWMMMGFEKEEANKKVSEYQRSLALLQDPEISKRKTPWGTQYWINKGFTEQQAKEKVSSIQSENCMKAFSVKRGSSIEIKLLDLLVSNGIEFKSQKYIKLGDKKAFVDFYLPENNLIIEVFGNYWHAHEDIKETHILGIPVETIRSLDAKRIQKLESLGYKVLIIWESELKQRNNDEIIEKIKNC